MASVDAERVYANVRTVWVEPETDVIVRNEERQEIALRFDGGATVPSARRRSGTTTIPSR